MTNETEREQEPSEESEGRATLPSVPDWISEALVVPDPGVVDEPTPTSVVDRWAFSDEEAPDSVLPRHEPSTNEQTVVDDWAWRESDDDETRDPGAGRMVSLTDEIDEPPLTTLRPSAVTLRPQRPSRRSGSGWVVGGLAVAAAIAVWAFRSSGDAAGAAAASAPPAPEAVETDGAAPSVQQGVRLRTDVEGVMATLGGESWGPLPVSLSHLSPGKHRLRFEAEGYHLLEREVVVQRGEMVDLEVALEPKPVKVILEVVPPNAFIMVSDSGNLSEGRRFPGPWPRVIELEPGTHHFVAFRKGFGTLQKPVTIPAGKKAQAVRFELSPAGFDPGF